MGLEIVEQTPDLEAVIVPVGCAVTVKNDCQEVRPRSQLRDRTFQVLSLTVIGKCSSVDKGNQLPCLGSLLV